MNPLFQIGASIAAPIIGDMLGGDRQSTATTTNAPWSAIQPQILGAIDGATSLLGQPRQFYPDSTVAPVSQYTTQGMQGAMNQAMGPSLSQNASQALPSAWSQQTPFGFGQLSDAYSSGLMGGNTTQGGDVARNSLMQMAGGGISGPSVQNINAQQISTPDQNPYLDDAFNQAADAVEARVNSQFASGGRLNSGAAQRAMSEQLSNAATNLYGAEATRQADRNLAASQANQGANLTAQRANQSAGLQGYGYGLQGLNQATSAANALLGNEQNRNSTANQALGLANQFYGNNQSNALRALGMAPGLESASYLPYQQMMQLGAMDRGFNQEFINGDRERFEFNENEPWQRIGDYLGMIGYDGSRYGTSSQPIYQNNGANIASSLLGAVPNLAGAIQNWGTTSVPQAQQQWASGLNGYDLSGPVTTSWSE